MNADRLSRPYRDVAADWHGGQCTPLYFYASTGTIFDGIVEEIDECLKGVGGSLAETRRLVALRRFVISVLDGAA